MSAINSDGRVTALDRTKGFSIALMFFIEGAGFFRALGPLYSIGADRRAERISIVKGVVFADFCTPLFIFLLGMSFAISFARRVEKDKRGTYFHFIKRNLIFMGLGSILVSAEYLLNGRSDPFIGQTVLMFMVIALAVFWLVLLIWKKKTVKIRKIVGYGITISLSALALIGIVINGIDAFQIFFSQNSYNIIKDNAFMHWSILHTIGGTGLLGLAFAHLKTRGKVIAFGVYAALYTAFQCIPIVEERRDILVLGGLNGVLGWVLVFLAGMIFIELFIMDKKAKWPCLIFEGICIALAVVSTICLPMSSRGVSSNFLFVSISAYALILLGVSLLDNWKPKFTPVTYWGRNPIVLFAVGLALKAALLIWLPYDVPLYVALLFLIGCFGTFGVITAIICHKKAKVSL